MRQPNRSRMTLTKSEKICYPALRAMMRRNRLIQLAGIGDCDSHTAAARLSLLGHVGLCTYRKARGLA
jgi:hypothetical protein